MAVQIGAIVMPTDMANRGLSYLFAPPATVAINGLGEAVTAGGNAIDWVFSSMSLSEWAWWTTTLLAGNASRSFSGVSGSTRFVNDQGVETAFSRCVVFRPVAEQFSGLYYRNVKVRIEEIY